MSVRLTDATISRLTERSKRVGQPLKGELNYRVSHDGEKSQMIEIKAKDTHSHRERDKIKINKIKKQPKRIA